MNNSREVIKNDKTYVFVTRGRSKPFSDPEVAEYFGEYIAEDEPQEDKWQIPNDHSRKAIFMKDLKFGIDFCAKKYAVNKNDIVREARRLAPHMRID